MKATHLKIIIRKFNVRLKKVSTLFKYSITIILHIRYYMSGKRVDMFTSKTIRYSLAASVLLFASTTLSAETMYEKFMMMEAKMKQLESEVNDLKAKNEALSEQISSKEESEDEEGAKEEEEKSSTASKAENDEKEDAKGASDDEESEDEEEDPQELLADLQESVEELNKATGNNHLKFNVDYRFAVDNLNYKMANGDEKKNDALLTNRLWLNMSWAATEKLSFKGQLAYQKAFGYRSTDGSNPLDDFDWVTNENPYDGKIRVKNAYFFYHDNQLLGSPVSWTFSVGRRPSTNGHLINLRDDDTPASPNGHSINVEFDGASAKFGFEEWVQGMYIKFCLGRGLTNASSRFLSIDSNNTVIENPPYADNPDALPQIDLAGFIFQPYSDGQYTVTTQYYYAVNLVDADIDYLTSKFQGFETVGNMHSFTASFIADGIGDGINDFLDDTTFFLSGAMSISDPDKSKDMFHSPFDSNYAQNKGKRETGYSVWAGLNIPSLISEEGKWGIEYNWGSQYWRSITYAEDTLIGSKVATRGSAYEVYFTEPLVEDILTAQIRYTYIKYDYTGSNGFFGSTSGAATNISDIKAAAAAGDLTAQQLAAGMLEKSQDIRFYIRYRY